MSIHNYTQHKTRRTYDRRFKADLVSQCINGNQSIAALALAHNMNPNVLHRWLSEHERFGYHDISDFTDEDNNEPDQSDSIKANWLSILPKPISAPELQPKMTNRLYKSNIDSLKDKPNVDAQTINISVKSDGLSLDLQWPHADHTGLAKFIKELMA